jgi:hypothetical protein
MQVRPTCLILSGQQHAQDKIEHGKTLHTLSPSTLTPTHPSITERSFEQSSSYPAEIPAHPFPLGRLPQPPTHNPFT